jgi:hypothetical protein
MAKDDCPVCNRGKINPFGAEAERAWDCPKCGRFRTDRAAMDDWFGPAAQLSPMPRAALSHHLRTASRSDGDPLITSDWMRRFIPDAQLPSLSSQATNLIRLIGDHFVKTGEGYIGNLPNDAAVVGALNVNMLGELLAGLQSKGLVKQYTAPKRGGPGGLEYGWSLTLDGSERYDAERKGLVAGKYGFIAMKFGVPTLETFVRDTVKPTVKSKLDYDLIDVRDVSQAGIIDNIMRAHIRVAAFVLVDLTHDNSGAYWEAGYAEGLGKPVIYLCEGSKFKKAKTHFDTNHCTTVPWSAAKPDEFAAELVATLRRSLNLFPKR